MYHYDVLRGKALHSNCILHNNNNGFCCATSPSAEGTGSSKGISFGFSQFPLNDTREQNNKNDEGERKSTWHGKYLTKKENPLQLLCLPFKQACIAVLLCVEQAQSPTTKS